MFFISLDSITKVRKFGLVYTVENFPLSFVSPSYEDYREPPWINSAMPRTLVYYHVLAVKFIFVFMFEVSSFISDWLSKFVFGMD